MKNLLSCRKNTQNYKPPPPPPPSSSSACIQKYSWILNIIRVCRNPTFDASVGAAVINFLKAGHLVYLLESIFRAGGEKRFLRSNQTGCSAPEDQPADRKKKKKTPNCRTSQSRNLCLHLQFETSAVILPVITSPSGTGSVNVNKGDAVAAEVLFSLLVSAV